MANRNIQAKILKIKKMKRLAPRKYSADYISVGSLPVNEMLGEGSARALSGIPTQFRKMTTDDKAAEEMSKKAVNEARFPSLFGFKVNGPRQAVLDRLKGMLENIPLDRHVVLYDDGKYRKDMLFFNSENTRYFILRNMMLEGKIMRSLTYPTRARAIEIYQRKAMIWKTRLKYVPAEFKSS